MDCQCIAAMSGGAPLSLHRIKRRRVGNKARGIVNSWCAGLWPVGMSFFSCYIFWLFRPSRETGCGGDPTLFSGLFEISEDFRPPSESNDSDVAIQQCSPPGPRLTDEATKIVVFLKAAVVQDVHISIKYAGICHSDIHQAREEPGLSGTSIYRVWMSMRVCCSFLPLPKGRTWPKHVPNPSRFLFGAFSPFWTFPLFGPGSWTR